MTISSHPWIKLLVAIIAAIFVGIIVDSWAWSIGTFLIGMFLFIWVAGWIFGGPIKGKVEVTDELEELLFKLEDIGNTKDELPLNARGWCNSLGLYVQLKKIGPRSRLQAGNSEYHSQIDAWQDNSSRESVFEWKVKKYEPGDWEKLVDPTYDIVNWLSKFGGLPEEYADSFSKAIKLFKKKSRLKLPDVMKTGSKRTPKAIVTRGKVEDEKTVKTRSNITKSRIEEYDTELLEDIDRLRKRISRDEEIEKEFMRSHGASEKTIKEVVQKARNEGSPISSFGSGEDMFRIQAFLTDSVPVYKEFPFRLWTREIPLQIPAETNVITKDDWLRFDTRPLNNEERVEYAKQWETTRVLNYTPNQIPVYKWYPTPELKRFVGNMLKKYDPNSVLTKDEYRDENMKSAREEALGSQSI